MSRKLKSGRGMVFEPNHEAPQKDKPFFEPGKNEGAVFSKEVPDIEGLRKCLFDAIDATIETMEKSGLAAGDVRFEYKGAKINCEIRLERNNN